MVKTKFWQKTGMAFLMNIIPGILMVALDYLRARLSGRSRLVSFRDIKDALVDVVDDPLEEAAEDILEHFSGKDKTE